MMRLLAAWVLAIGVAGTAVARPPVESVVQGKERSPIDIELYQPERVAPPETGPTLPKSRDEIISAAFAELRSIVSMQLGTVPLVRPVLW